MTQHAHAHPQSQPRRPAPLSTALLLAPALALLGCGGPATTARTGIQATEQADVAAASACEGAALMANSRLDFPPPDEPLGCDEFDAPPDAPTLVAPTTLAACRALPADEQSACRARLRALPRVTRLVEQALAAERTQDHGGVIRAYEQALELAPADPGLLGDLGWARFRARAWCQETQDRFALRDAEEGDDPSARRLAQLCLDDATLDLAIADLTGALEVPREPRARTLHRLGVALVAGAALDDALAVLRESLCLREDAEVRHALAELLFSLGHVAGAAAPEEAVGRYRQAQMVEPNAGTAGFVHNVLMSMNEAFALSPPPPLAYPSLYASLEELCRALVLRDPSQPDDESVPLEDLCETSEWDDVGVAVGDDTHVFFQVALLTASDPDAAAGDNTVHLVARTPRGVNILLDLGRDHGSSRTHAAFVGAIATDYRFDAPDAPLVVRWTNGEAQASDCDWDGWAYAQLAACGLVGDLPRCFAWASLGPADYIGDMLPTVQESLGNCDDDRPPRVPWLDPNRFLPSFDVSLTTRELALTRATDGAMTCLPLPESLTPLRRRAAGR